MKKEFKRILVTAALPYANGKIHLGHLAGAYLPADIYVRYQRSMRRDIVFICGSDEHGVPITITADKQKITPQQVVDHYHEMNKEAFRKFGVSFDNYSRTSLPIHHETSKEFFLAFHKNGILKEKREKQLFDAKANMFLPDRYVEGTCPVCKNPEARGDQCERCGTFLSPMELINPKSKITGEKPDVRETSHWYFPLGDYQKRLEAYIEEKSSQERWKENVLAYCNSWFKDGLADRAVTRDLNWGVQVPLKGYEDKVLYVWFEAVLGYISSTKEWSKNIGQPDAWKKYWLSDATKYVAFIGKDNVVFHCIVFPAMLMAWNDSEKEHFLLPDNVPANEFLNFESQKFSKSRGWGVDLDEFLEVFPADTLRYTLTMNLPELRDADFTWKDFQARTNNELADILGNFVNRTLTFAHKNFAGKVPARGALTKLDEELVKQLRSTTEKAGQLIDQYRIRDSALEIMNLARFANKYFNDNEPWKSLKENRERCSTTINLCLQTIRSLAVLFAPILPFTVEKIWRFLNVSSIGGWQSASELFLPENHPLGQPEILFTKIEDDVIQGKMQGLTGGDAEVPKKQQEQETPQITIDDFKKVELRVAKVISVEKVSKSDKLLKVQISLGDEQRQIIAGIAQHYTLEDLVGKKVVVVTNLQPAKLMGQQSNGMLLAASDNDGNLSVLTVARDMVEGSIIK